MHVRNRVLAALAALILAGVAGTTSTLAASPALANTGQQWCDNLGYCPNAWNGGPAVAVYQYPASNNDFNTPPDVNECNGGYTTSTCPGSPIPAGLAIDFLQFTGGGSYGSTCMEDNGNNPGDAKASIGGSCSGTGGWGANFVYLYQGSGSCQGDVIFYNIHWKGAIAVSSTDGARIYLNSQQGSCLRALPPA